MTDDPIVDIVVRRLIDRSAEGMKNYGVSMKAASGNSTKWIDNAIEELLDAACYLEKLKDTLGE